MAEQLFASLNVRPSTTASYHPQCNSQVEVCNKTITKYLAAFVNESTLDWEIYVAALAFAYNTSFHRSIKATLFGLTFCIEARLPLSLLPTYNIYTALPYLAIPSWITYMRPVTLRWETT